MVVWYFDWRFDFWYCVIFVVGVLRFDFCDYGGYFGFDFFDCKYIV